MHTRSIIVFCLLLTGPSGFAQQTTQADADTLFDHQQFEKALTLYSQMIRNSRVTDSSYFPNFYKRAVCFYSIGDFRAALQDLAFCIHDPQETFQARLLRSFVYRELKQPDLQMSDLNELIKESPMNPFLRKARASAYFDQGEYTKGLKDLKAARLILDDAETELYMAHAYYNTGHLDSAMACINRVVDTDTAPIEAYLDGASFCLQSSEFELALQYTDGALKLEPKNATALFLKGVALIELKQTDLGCSCLNKAFYAGEDDAGDYLKEYCYGIED